jgi:phage terminase small subunit
METKLTQKQDAFCLAYLETGNATEAYRKAYHAQGMLSATVNRKAKELMDNGKITARIGELKRPVIEKAQLTFEGHLDELKRLRDLAIEANSFASAVSAEIARGKASGYYVAKSQVDLNQPIKPLVLVIEHDDELPVIEDGHGPLIIRRSGNT